MCSIVRGKMSIIGLGLNQDLARKTFNPFFEIGMKLLKLLKLFCDYVSTCAIF